MGFCYVDNFEFAMVIYAISANIWVDFVIPASCECLRNALRCGHTYIVLVPHDVFGGICELRVFTTSFPSLWVIFR